MANIHSRPDLFNIDIVAFNNTNTKHLGEVINTNVFETNSSVFAAGSLFDTKIFGQVGSQERNETPGVIDLGVPVLHPYLYIILCSLGDKYEQVFEGKKYATFDTTKKDITIVSNREGSTGYTYMLSTIKKVQWNDNNSDQRRYKIDLVNKYLKDEYLCTKWLVLPAGLRDYVEDKNGVPSEDEVNSLYRNLIGTASLIKSIKVGTDLSLIDPIRLKLQKILVEIFQYFKTLLDGKSKFIQGKFAKRAIRYGTRNVITPMPPQVKDLTSDQILTMNHTTVGLYQYIKSIAPITMNRVSSIFINHILNPNNTQAYLINPDTKKTELVNIPIKKRDEWFTIEGLNDIMNKLAQPELRVEPVKIDKYYLLMLYDDGKNIKIFLHTDEIREELNKKYLRPITYAELFFISVVGVVDKYPGFVTRYPVAGLGGIYPTKIYLKTTINARTVELEYGGTIKTLKEYPILDSLFVESMSPHTSRIGLLGADYDGDSVRGSIIVRFKKSKFDKLLINDNNKKSKFKVNNMSLSNSKKAVYAKGLINLKDFPRGEIIKVDGHKEYYSVPEEVEVLTVWNGEIKWVKPESYSIHKNLNMISVKTHRGNTIECSDDHSLVTIDENLNYKRANPCNGMVMPKLRNAVNNYVSNRNYMYILKDNNNIFNLNHDLGYLFGIMVGDGWVNKDIKHKGIMLANNNMNIANKITEIMKGYGYNGNLYTISNEHDFDGFKCHSTKHTWCFSPIENLLRKYIGIGAFNKKLPSFWTKTTAKFRWGLLAGLIDTDGTIKNIRDNYALSYCTVSEELAYDIIALGNSLGVNVGMTILQRRHKTTKEYYLSFRVKDNIKFKKHLKLLIKEKYDKIQQSKDIKEDLLDLLPTITVDKIKELRSYLTYDTDKLNYGRISDSLRRSLSHGIGCNLVRSHYIEIYNKYQEQLSKSKFWNKLYKIALDKKIEWEVIKEVKPLPEITEAYDLTTPPHCTFVLQNGIVVYDTTSLNIIYTDEAIKEIDKFLDSPTAYTTPTGSIAYSQNSDVVDLVMKSLTE